MPAVGAQNYLVHGTTVSFATSSTWDMAGGATDVELLSISHSGGGDRAVVDVSHVNTAAPSAGTFGNRSFLLGSLTSPGEFTIECHLDPDVIPVLNAIAEVMTITFPKRDHDTSGPIWLVTGGMTGYEMSGPSADDKYTCTFTWAATGEITITAAA